jgi:hypothetical protein
VKRIMVRGGDSNKQTKAFRRHRALGKTIDTDSPLERSSQGDDRKYYKSGDDRNNLMERRGDSLRGKNSLHGEVNETRGKTRRTTSMVSVDRENKGRLAW